MSEMIETLSRAIHDAQQAAMAEANKADAPLDMSELDRIAARAALTALMQPNEAMTLAGLQEMPWGNSTPLRAERVFVAMLSAALSGDGK